MKIRLTKNVKVGTVDRLKGWEGEVDEPLGLSIINNNRAIELGGITAKKKATKKKTLRKAPVGD